MACHMTRFNGRIREAVQCIIGYNIRCFRLYWDSWLRQGSCACADMYEYSEAICDTESCRLHLEDTGENCKIRSGIYEEGACPQDKPPPRRYFAHLLNILLSTYSAGHPWSACRAWTSALQRNAPAGSLPQS